MLQGFPITFNIYANDAQEVEVLRFVITEFIRKNAEEGRAVSATILTEALQECENNPIVRNRVKRFLDGKQ
jgi:hypothetical protein